MAEIAVSLAHDKLLPLLTEEARRLREVPKEFEEIKDLLESIQAFIKDADRRAAAEEDQRVAAEENGSVAAQVHSTNEEIRKWVKLLREEAFRIEDVIDEYMTYVGQHPRDPGCEALLCDIVHFIKTLIPRCRIASEIQDIKLSVGRIKERSEKYRFQIKPSFEQGSNRSRESPDVNLQATQIAYPYIEEDQLVGLEVPRDELIGWLVDASAERTVISVVGMGGLGKTTIAKKVFDNPKVIEHFDCLAWITVSQSYTVERLLRDMLKKFYDGPPEHILEMDKEQLTKEVKSYLQQKRYVVFFDDVWNKKFWKKIKKVVVDNKKGSRIFITTRNSDVANYCKESSLVKVYELQSLTLGKSLELFYKTAFRSDFDGCCPKELIDISLEIVKKCNGLPLAIVAIGGLLAGKTKSASEWGSFKRSLSSELENESDLTVITKILALSYDDLPYHLKSCLLYFGVYPEDSVVKSKRLIRQWVAEGFVTYEKGLTFDEVAEKYLRDLVSRNLVQVSSFSIDGKAKGCRVHDLLHDMILKKFKDISFCHCIMDDDQSALSGIIRRLSITSNPNDLMGSIETSHVRSLLVLRGKDFPDYFVSSIPAKYKLLKLLDFQGYIGLTNIPKNLGNLIHLKYLSFRHSSVQNLPKSIVKLQNLETLDLRNTAISMLPKEISKLRKLRHLLGAKMYFTQLKDDIGRMRSLETLCKVVMMIEEEGVELIRELGKLRHLRELSLIEVKGKHESALCSSINKMKYLQKLYIKADDVIDLSSISSPPPMLRKLYLHAKLPEWEALSSISSPPPML